MKRWMLLAIVGMAAICVKPCWAEEYSANVFKDVPRSTAFYRDVETLQRFSHGSLLPINCYGNRSRILTRYEFAVITKRMVDAMPDLKLKLEDAVLANRIVSRLKSEFAAELQAITEGSKPVSKPVKAAGS
jgi:hypothetical protein